MQIIELFVCLHSRRVVGIVVRYKVSILLHKMVRKSLRSFRRLFPPALLLLFLPPTPHGRQEENHTPPFTATPLPLLSYPTILQVVVHLHQATICGVCCPLRRGIDVCGLSAAHPLRQAQLCGDLQHDVGQRLFDGVVAHVHVLDQRGEQTHREPLRAEGSRTRGPQRGRVGALHALEEHGGCGGRRWG